MSGSGSRTCRFAAPLIGAIVRDGKAVFPRGDEVLRPGDRVIVFTESQRVAEVEKAL